ncbi:hypothetical protein [Desulfonatronum parangueonense]
MFEKNDQHGPFEEQGQDPSISGEPTLNSKGGGVDDDFGIFEDKTKKAAEKRPSFSILVLLI